MIDISKKIEAKGISLESIFDEQEKLLQSGIRSMAMATYDDLVQLAGSNLYTSRQDYIKSLKFTEVGNLYIISIGAPGYYYEEGFDGFDQKPGLVHGPRAKTAKDGHKYNIIPFQHEPFSKNVPPRQAEWQKELRSLVKNLVQIDPRSIRDRSGAIVGEVIAKAPKETEGFGAGLIKIRKTYANKRPQHSYMTFRGVSEKNIWEEEDASFWEDDYEKKWIHPGFKGLHGFEAAEKAIDDRIDQIISVIWGV